MISVEAALAPIDLPTLPDQATALSTPLPLQAHEAPKVPHGRARQRVLGAGAAISVNHGGPRVVGDPVTRSPDPKAPVDILHREEDAGVDYSRRPSGLGREQQAGADHVLDLSGLIETVVDHQVPANDPPSLEEALQRGAAQQRKQQWRIAPGGVLETAILEQQAWPDQPELRALLEEANQLLQRSVREPRVAVQEHHEPPSGDPHGVVARRALLVDRQADYGRIREPLGDQIGGPVGR